MLTSVLETRSHAARAGLQLNTFDSTSQCRDNMQEPVLLIGWRKSKRLDKVSSLRKPHSKEVKGVSHQGIL